MLKKSFSIIGFFALVLSASVSNAIYIEPYLNLYGKGTAKMTTPSVVNDEQTEKLGYGLRLGYSFAMLAAGAEYSAENVDSTSMTGTTNQAAVTGLGAFVSFNFPVLPVRAYLTYFFDSKVTGSSVLDTKGKGTKLGVSFTGLPFVFINLEYHMMKYNDIIGIPADMEVNRTVLSVSLPFDF